MLASGKPRNMLAHIATKALRDLPDKSLRCFPLSFALDEPHVLRMLPRRTTFLILWLLAINNPVAEDDELRLDRA